MVLNEWIDNKLKELIASKVYKSVAFLGIDNVEIEKNMTSETFELNGRKEIPMNIEIEEFTRSELTTRIKGLKVTFEIVKPRCRKPETIRLYVKIVN